MVVNMQTKFVAVLETRGFAIVKRSKKYIVMGKEQFQNESRQARFLVCWEVRRIACWN